jgi:indole-3-glycerol phosphate synthase
MTLKDILAASYAESEQRQLRYPIAMIQRKVEKMRSTRGFANAIRAQPFSVIAEIKRQSPSMGTIDQSSINRAHEIYATHPLVSAISVLTQNRFFKGTIEDLESVRKLTQNKPKPILRKDFILSDYEVYFSRWIGADAILLMANVVEDKSEFKRLHDLAISIGLDVLCEIHDEEEISTLPDTVKICGINSRRFKGVKLKIPFLIRFQDAVIGLNTANRDTQTDLNAFSLFEKLSTHLPTDCLKIAESGLSADNIGKILKKYRFDSALIGTSILKSGGYGMEKMLDRIREEAELALNASRSTELKSEVSFVG